ncbi:MAG: calcium-binding protein, partial [Planctomycetia bacterium]
MYKFVNLEERLVPASAANLLNATLTAGVLNIQGSNKADAVLVDTADGAVRVNLNGQVQSFNGVTALVFNGGNGDDMFVNRAGLPSIASGGNGADYLVGGTADDVLKGDNGADNLEDVGGNNTIFGGNGNDNVDTGAGNHTIFGEGGDDVLYALLGNNLLDGGRGRDILMGGAGNRFNADKQDQKIEFFVDRGAELALQDGVLYFLGTASTANRTVVVDEVGANLNVTVDGTTSVFKKSDVKFIAGFFGSGNDVYVNNSSVDSVFYGAAGNDVLVGGT